MAFNQESRWNNGSKSLHSFWATLYRPINDSDNDLSKFGPIDDILNQFWARLIAWTKLTLSRLFIGPGIESEPKMVFSELNLYNSTLMF